MSVWIQFNQDLFFDCRVSQIGLLLLQLAKTMDQAEVSQPASHPRYILPRYHCYVKNNLLILVDRDIGQRQIIGKTYRIECPLRDSKENRKYEDEVSVKFDWVKDLGVQRVVEDFYPRRYVGVHIILRQLQDEIDILQKQQILLSKTLSFTRKMILQLDRSLKEIDLETNLFTQSWLNQTSFQEKYAQLMNPVLKIQLQAFNQMKRIQKLNNISLTKIHKVRNYIYFQNQERRSYFPSFDDLLDFSDENDEENEGERQIDFLAIKE